VATLFTTFALRNYDAQIGRWVQQDPYQQFASPYLGMGNDPVNVIDPSGGIGIPCPGTSALSIFLENAVYAIGNALNSVSKVFNVVGMAATITQTATVTANVIEASNTINGQLQTNAVGIAVSGSGEGEENPNYWISYDGTKVNIYEGEDGNFKDSKLLESLAGTSGGVGYQNSGQQDEPEKGPVPDGEFKINLSIGPRNRKVSYDKDGKTNQDVGIQQMTDRSGTGFNAAWGRWRARLEKINVKSGRDNFYFHDSYKGYSHGCIETETRLFYFLLGLHDAGYTSIKVIVKYSNNNTSTNGGTRGLPLKTPQNVVPYYKKYGYPPGSMGNKKYGKIPVPPPPYKYVPTK
jgi:hypothetical protein